MGEQLFCAFLVVGPDPSLRPLEGTDTKSQGCVFLKTLLGTTYGATTLACYPPKLPEFVPPSIWLFALPRAIRYTTSRDTTAPECFSFAVSSRSGVTLFGTSLTYLRQVDPQIQQKVTDEEYSPIESTLYAPHTVCLLSRLPLMSLGRRWLIEISKIIFEGRKKGGSSLPLESFLWNMISVSRVPPEGYTLLIPTPLGGTYPLYRPTEWEFPFLDMPIGHIFMSLDLRSIIMLVGSLYQEKRLLLVSKSKTLLFHVAHTLVTLIYPLTWNYTYIPVLPDRLMNFVTSDRPYILGVHSDALAREEVKSQIGKVVIANLDDNTVSIPPGVADPPQFEIKQLEGAMNHILATNLNDLDSPSTLPSNEPPRIPRFEEMIKVSFLNFFLSLFGEFRHFLLFLMEKPKVVAYLEAHKLTHHYLCVAEKRIRGCRKGMMMWEMVGSGLLVEERGEDDGGVDDGKAKKSPLEEVQMDNEVEKIYSFYMKVVKTKMFWHFCQKFSEPGNSVVDLWLQHKDRQKEQFDAHKMKRKGKEEGSDMQGAQGEKEGEELFEEISGFVEEHLSDPFYPSPYAQSVAPASSSNFIVSSLSPAFISEKMGKKKKKFVYENGFPTSFSNSFLEASQDLENEGSFVRMMRSLAPLCIPGSAPDPIPRDLPFIPRPKELKAKKALEKFIGAVLQHQDVDSSSLYDYFTDAVALVTSLSAFPIRRDLVGVLKYSTSRNPPTPSSSSSSSFSPSDSKRIELDPNIFELLGAIVECALLQCQERKDLQTAMLFYEVSGNFILKQKVKHKKERKSLEGRGGGEEEPMKYVSSDGDMSDDLSGREGGEGEGERKTAGDFGEESISLRDRFSMSGIWSEEELWVAHLADRIQAMKQRYPGKSAQKDGRSLYVKAIVEEAVEMLRFGISADKVKAVVDWCSKTGDLSQKDCKTLLNHLEAAVSESNVMKQQDRSSKRRAQGLYSRDLRKLGLDRADWNSLLATGKLTKFTSGDVIMKYEEQLSCLFVVKKGTVRVDKPGLGSSSTMTAYLEQDRLFGEMCLLDQNAKAAATITAAAERTEIISIPCAKVFEMFERRPELTTAVARSLALSLSNALKHQQDDRQMFSPPAKQRKKAIFKKTDAIARYSVTYKTKLIKKKGLLCVLIEGLYFLSDKKQKSVKRWKYENLQLFQGEKNNEMVVEDSSLQGSQFVLKMASIKELEELTSFVSQAQSGWGGHRGDIVTTLKTKQRLSNVPDRETPQLLTLGDEDWNWLLHMTQCVAYHRDDVIIEEGSKQRRLIQIGSGHVRIVKKVVVSSDSGSPVDSYDEDFSDLSTDARTDVEEMVLGRMGFGEVLGTINYLESGGATASVIADDETVDIYLLEGPVVDLLISTRKGFGGRFYTFLCSELMDCLAQRMN